MSELHSAGHENEYRQPTISELLPRYYEAYGESIRYEVLRSIPIDGHEVAWLKYTGETSNGRSYTGHELHCGCHFTEGVGWQVDEKYGVVGLDGEDNCLPRKVAVYLRQQELREEFAEQYKDSAIWGKEYALLDHIPEVVLGLIEKDKAGEFIGEGTSGAHFWGGHLYMQTVEAITGAPMSDLWKVMDTMRAAKQINLEGCVIQEYTEPPEPKWEEYARLEYEGYTGIAKLPAHSKMPQHWEIVILAQNGRTIAEGIEGPALTHSPDFGVDVEDAANVEAAIKVVIDGYLWDPMRQA